MTKQAATFKDLDLDAAELDYFDPLRERVVTIVSHSEENAPDDAGRIASVVDLLAYEPCADVRAWFAARGVSA